jgi:WD40 repeat protein
VIKLGRKRTGILALKSPVADPSRLVLSFEDGSVAVFSLLQRRIEFTTSAAHSETVFDCRYKPSSPDVLATASYDGTVKVWDTRTMTCTADLKGQEGTRACTSSSHAHTLHRTLSARSPSTVGNDRELCHCASERQ